MKALLYNPFDPALRSDPYPIYRRLRETEPVHRSPLGFWVLSRYADVAAVQRDPSLGFFSTRLLNRVMNAGIDPASPEAKALRWVLFIDKERHRRFRGLMSRFFSPRSLESMGPRISAVVEQLLDRLPTDRPVDVIEEFARPLPITVLCEWMGIPRADRAGCYGWSAAIGRVLLSVLSPDMIRSMRDALDISDRYFQALVSERRRHPGDDMLSALIETEFEHEPITDDELIGNVVLLFGASYETTANLLGNGLLALLRNPDQLDLLRAEPALVGDAVEELLRYDSPAQLHGRWTLTELEVGDTVIPADSRLIILIGSANRDPAQFPDPDSLNVRRPDVRPTSFGGGVHHCLGAGMARLEAQVAFSLLLKRFPRIQLVGEPLQWRSDYVAVRGLKELRVELAVS